MSMMLGCMKIGWLITPNKQQNGASLINDDLFKKETYNLLLKDGDGNPIFNIGDDVVIRF